ncbi:2TM domain-containing protein [Chloroflexota bacterium]
MPTEMSEQEIYEEAKKRVKAKRGFYRNLGSYLVVNVVLIIIWALSGGPTSYSGDWTGGKWFLWPLTIWGVFVVVNFLEVFVFKASIRGERSSIEEEIKKMKKE